MSKWKRSYLIVLVVAAFQVQANDKSEEFENFIHQNVANVQLKSVAFEASDVWSKLLDIYRGSHSSISESEAKAFTAELVSIEMCLTLLQQHLVNEPSIKGTYFNTMEATLEYVSAGNNMARLVGEDNSQIQLAIPEVICSNHLTDEDIENITKQSR